MIRAPMSQPTKTEIPRACRRPTACQEEASAAVPIPAISKSKAKGRTSMDAWTIALNATAVTADAAAAMRRAMTARASSPALKRGPFPSEVRHTATDAPVRSPRLVRQSYLDQLSPALIEKLL